MSAAAKPHALTLVLDLTRRLAADFPAVPIDLIASSVQGATSAVRLFGEDVAGAMATVETLARADLGALLRETPLAATQPVALAS